MNLLVVDSENTHLVRHLSEAGFHIHAADSIDEGLQLFRSHPYDVVLVDTALGAPVGFPLLNEISKSERPAMTVALSVPGAVQDRIRALEITADASLIKPFQPAEVLATIRSLLRRQTKGVLENYQIGDLELDLVHRSAKRAGNRLELTPKEFALLSALVRSPGEPLTRPEIFDRVWQSEIDYGTNVVDVHIRRLRAKVDDPYRVKLIHTVRGRGYMVKQPD